MAGELSSDSVYTENPLGYTLTQLHICHMTQSTPTEDFVH